MTKYTLKEKNMVRRIVVIYGVGVVGFSIPPLTHGAFMLLTPLVLLLSFLLLIWYDSGRRSGGS